MRAKSYGVVTILVTGFALGAVLGRQWKGNLADSVLALVALLTFGLVAIVIVDYFRDRARVVAIDLTNPTLVPPETLSAEREDESRAIEEPSPAPIARNKHFVILQRDDKWVVRVQDWWRIKFFELAFALPRGKAVAKTTPASTTRKVIDFLIGLAFVLMAQYAMFQTEPWLFHFVFGERLNSLFRFDFLNLDNVILAMILLVAGVFFFLRGIREQVPPDPGLMEGSLALPDLKTDLWRRLGALAIATAIVFLFLLWRLNEMDISLWLPLLWIVALTGFGVIVYYFDRRGNITLSLNAQKQDVILITLIFAMGLIVGTYRLAQVPNSFIGDEGTFWDTARSIANWEYRPSLFDFGVYSYPVLSSYYQALILKLFGFSVWSWRFASVLAGVAAVVPTYLLAREMFDRRVAVLAGAVMVVTPYFLAIERLGYNNAQALLPVAGSVYFMYAGLKRNSALFLYLGGMAAGFGFYTYTAARLGLVVAALFFAYLLVMRGLQLFNRTRETFQPAMRTLVLLGVVFVVGWGVTALPLIVFGNTVSTDLLRAKIVESVFANDIYAHDFLPGEDLFRDNPPIQIGPYTLFNRTDLIARLLVRGTVRSFLVFQHDRMIGEHFIAGPLAGHAGAAFYFLGLVVTLANLRRKNFVLLAVWFFSGVILLSVISTFPPRHMHLVPIIPVLSIFIALGIMSIADFLAAQVPRWQSAIPRAVMLASFGVIALIGLDNYFFTVQQTYLPIPEHIMGFAQLELTSPRKIVNVYTNPADMNFAPWEARAIPNLGTFRQVKRDDLLENRFAIDPGKPTTFFFTEQDKPVVIEFLMLKLNREINFKSYFNRDGQVILMSYAFGD